MTDRQILILKNSWSFVVVKSDETSEFFHSRLCQIFSEGSAAVNHDHEASIKFMSSITRLIAKLQLPADFEIELRTLNLTSGVGSSIICLPQIREALMDTIALSLRQQWTDEVKGAWIVFFQTLSDRIK
jgi:hypothetical protein